MEHRFSASMVLPLERQQVFEFFSDAHNLERITPPELGFRILTPGPIRIQAGTRLDYRLRLLGIPFRWQSLISAWEPPHRFVDEQTKGPYRSWRHQHSFVEEDGGTRIVDEVLYRLPLAPIGELGYPLVRFNLGRIFRYRERAIRRFFAKETSDGV